MQMFCVRSFQRVVETLSWQLLSYIDDFQSVCRSFEGCKNLVLGALLILLFACGGQEADHLHRQLQPLKVMFQILSFHCEAVLLVFGGNTAWRKQHQHHKGSFNGQNTVTHQVVWKQYQELRGIDNYS